MSQSNKKFKIIDCSSCGARLKLKQPARRIRCPNCHAEIEITPPQVVTSNVNRSEISSNKTERHQSHTQQHKTEKKFIQLLITESNSIVSATSQLIIRSSKLIVNYVTVLIKLTHTDSPKSVRTKIFSQNSQDNVRAISGTILIFLVLAALGRWRYTESQEITQPRLPVKYINSADILDPISDDINSSSSSVADLDNSSRKQSRNAHDEMNQLPLNIKLPNRSIEKNAQPSSSDQPDTEVNSPCDQTSLTFLKSLVFPTEIQLRDAISQLRKLGLSVRYELRGVRPKLFQEAKYLRDPMPVDGLFLPDGYSSLHDKKVFWINLNSIPWSSEGDIIDILDRLPNLDFSFGLDLRHRCSDRIVKSLTRFSRLAMLDISESIVTDAGLAVVKDLPHLTALSVGRTKVTDKGIEFLLDVSNLSILKLEELRLDGPDLFVLSDLCLSSIDLSGVDCTGRRFKDFKAFRSASCLKLSGIKLSVEILLRQIGPAGNLRILDVSKNPLTSAAFRQIGLMSTLLGLKINQCGSRGDQDLKELLHLHNLESLSIQDSHLYDADLDIISQIHSLKSLDISDNINLTSRGISRLAELKNLERLNLTNTECTDNTIRSLNALKNIKHLSLMGTGISDAGLAELVQFPNLEILELSDSLHIRRGSSGRSQVWSPSGIRSLSLLPNLKTLILKSADLTDEHAREISKFKSLTTVNLGNNNITLDGIRGFRGNDRIVAIDLYGHEPMGGFERVFSSCVSLRYLHVGWDGGSVASIHDGCVEVRKSLPDCLVNGK